MAASLPNEPDDLLITDELRHRIAHKADYQREKLIQDLARQMAEQPDQVLPRLVHLAMELCGGQSAGISLYEAQPPGPGIFRWHHLAGRYANFSGGTAVKYGALSIDQGLVHVTWQIEADNLLLRWEERKGPGIEKTPTSEGFGSILDRRSIVGQLGGELDYIWKPEGFSASPSPVSSHNEWDPLEESCQF